MSTSAWLPSMAALSCCILFSISGCGSSDDSTAADAPGQDASVDVQDPDGGDDALTAFDAQPDSTEDAMSDAATDVVAALEDIEAEPDEGAVVPRNRALRISFASAVVRSTLSIEINGQPARFVSTDDTEFRYAPLPLFTEDADHVVRVAAGLTDVTGAVLQEDWTRTFHTDASTIEVDGDPAWTTEETDLILSGAADEPMDLVQDYDDSQSKLYDINPPVQVPDAITEHLVDRMLVSMIHHGGIGLAAPQIGIGRRLFVARINGTDRAFLNPELSAHADEVDAYKEGCLSVPFKQFEVLRPIWIEFAYSEPDGTYVPFERVENATGIHARVWLHEFDHLNGILLLEREGQ